MHGLGLQPWPKSGWDSPEGRTLRPGTEGRCETEASEDEAGPLGRGELGARGLHHVRRGHRAPVEVGSGSGDVAEVSAQVVEGVIDGLGYRFSPLPHVVAGEVVGEVRDGGDVRCGGLAGPVVHRRADEVDVDRETPRLSAVSRREAVLDVRPAPYDEQHVAVVRGEGEGVEAVLVSRCGRELVSVRWRRRRSHEPSEG